MEVANPLPNPSSSSSLKRRRDPSTADDGDNVNPHLSPTVSTGVHAIETSPSTEETLNIQTLKKLVLSFERRLRDNIEARLKYVDQPEKFEDSEVELHEELQKLKALSIAPELYPELVNLNIIPSILGLLNHENTAIAIDVVSLLQGLIEDKYERAKVLVDNLVENNVLELLVHNLLRLNENEIDKANAMTLSTLENLIEVKPSVAEIVCEKTELMKWLLGKIKGTDFNGGKEYASEILAILLENSTENQKRLGQMDGVDVILQAVAKYKSKNPKTFDEEEMLDNLFDCLFCLLMPLENKESFVNGNGVELMISLMEEMNWGYGYAIRALGLAMEKYSPACERFVDVSGLNMGFAAFMGEASSMIRSY